MNKKKVRIYSTAVNIKKSFRLSNDQKDQYDWVIRARQGDPLAIKHFLKSKGYVWPTAAVRGLNFMLDKEDLFSKKDRFELSQKMLMVKVSPLDKVYKEAQVLWAKHIKHDYCLVRVQFNHNGMIQDYLTRVMNGIAYFHINVSHWTNLQ
jgi:hypothetical protein